MGEILDRLFDGDARIDEGVHGKQRRLGVSLEKIGGDGDGPIESDKPELRLNRFHRDVPRTEGDDLIKKGIGISHRTGGLSGDPEEGVVVRLDALVVSCCGEAFFDEIQTDELEEELLAAGTDRRRHFLQFGGCENEDHVGRRFFQRFEQRVERADRKHVDFVDDVDLVAAGLGRKEHFVLDLPDIIDPGVAGSVDFNDIDAVAGFDFDAVAAHPARFGGRTFIAVQGTGKDSGSGGFSHSAGTAEEIRMGDSPLGDRAFDRGNDERLTDKSGKLLRSLLCCGYFIL